MWTCYVLSFIQVSSWRYIDISWAAEGKNKFADFLARVTCYFTNVSRSFETKYLITVI